MVSGSSSQSSNIWAIRQNEILSVINDSFTSRGTSVQDATNHKIEATISNVFEFVTSELDIAFSGSTINAIPLDDLKSTVEYIVEKAKILCDKKDWTGVRKQSRETLEQGIILLAKEGIQYQKFSKNNPVIEKQVKHLKLMSDNDLMKFSEKIRASLTDAEDEYGNDIQKMGETREAMINAAHTLIAYRVFGREPDNAVAKRTPPTSLEGPMAAVQQISSPSISTSSTSLPESISSSPRSSLSSSSDSDIGSVGSDDVFEVLEETISMNGTEQERQLVRSHVQENLEELNSELNTLLDMADRARNAAESADKGNKDTEPCTSEQIKTLLNLFDITMKECQKTRNLAAKYELTTEFHSTFGLQDILLEQATNRLQALLPADEQAKIAQKPLSAQEQMARIWHIVDLYESTAQKSLQIANGLEKKLKDVEAILKQTQQKVDTAADQKKLADAQQSVNDIKASLHELKETLEAIGNVTSSDAIESLEDRISASLDVTQELRERAEHIYYLQFESTVDGVKPKIALLLLEALQQYAKAIVDLLEKQEQSPTNARNLKKISEQHEALNNAFSKKLDEIESQIQEVFDRKEAAKRAAEAKTQQNEPQQPSRLASRHNPALAAVVAKTAQKLQRGEAPMPNRTTTSVRASSEINRPKPLTESQQNQQRQLASEALVRRLALKKPKHIMDMTKPEREQARQQLLKNLKSKTLPAKKAVDPKELEAFQAAAADQAKASRKKAQAHREDLKARRAKQ